MEENDDRKDPTSFLPEEPMNYEPRKKKKRKKHKHVHEDPFKDVDTVIVPSKTVMKYDLEPCLDPEVKIKVEDIDINDDCNQIDSSYMEEDHQSLDADELLVPMTEENKPNVILTFEKVETEGIKSEKLKEEPNTGKNMCDECHLVFRTARNLQVHQNKVHNKHKKLFIYACKDCDKKYSVRNSLAQHRRKIHSSQAVPKDNLEQTCDICALVFKGAWRVRLHKLRHHGLFQDEYRFKCRQCGMSYDNKVSLKAHIGRKHKKKKNVKVHWYQCPICPHVYSNRDTYVRHIQRKHHQKDEKIPPEFMQNVAEVDKSCEISCNECPMVFSSLRYLTLHMRRNHNANIEESEMSEMKKACEVHCKKCPMVFTTVTYLRLHMKRHHNVKIEESEDMSEIKKAGEITCKECPMVFTSVTYLKLHMRRNHNAEIKEFRLNCALCKLSFDKLESLKRHVKRKHIGKVHCEICGKYFESQIAFDKHVHDDKKSVHECSICSTIFISAKGLTKHMRCAHKTGMKTLFCTVCKKGFQDAIQIRRHMMKVHLNVRYKCQFCEKTLKTRDSFRAHMTRVHSGQFPSIKGKHVCSLCPGKFNSEHELCKHIHDAHNASEIIIKTENVEIKKDETPKDAHNTSFQCNRCEASRPTFNELKKHHEQEHYQMEKTQCQVCGELIPVVDLPKHIKTAHPPDKNLPCMFCDFISKSKASLTQHLLRHKGAQTLQCDYPNCRFNSFFKENMEKHKRKHKEIGAKLQCSRCPFQCMNKYILKYHEESHTSGKKKFQCDKCEYATNLPGNFMQHKLKHTDVKRFKCEYCTFATKYATSLRFHVRKKHCDLTDQPKSETL